MRARMRLTLPLLPVLLAAVLLWSNSLKPNMYSDPAWRYADWQICVGINAPAFIVAEPITYEIYKLSGRGLVSEGLTTVSVTVTRLSLVWLTWFLVVVELGGRGRSVLAHKTRSPTIAAGLAILFGYTLLAASASVNRLGGGYARRMVIPHIVWTLAIIGFYGRDLWRSRRRANL